MKNFNFSSYALVVLCCLVLLATSCQDDPLESDLQPTDAIILNETLSGQTLSEAPTGTDNTLSFRATLTVEESNSGEDLVRYRGAITLQPISYLPSFISFDLPTEIEYQSYVGELSFNKDGQLATRAVAAVVTEDETFFLINNVPATSTGIVFGSSDPLEDFKAEYEVVNAQGQPVVAILNVDIDRPIPPIGIGEYFYEYEVAITTQLPGSNASTELSGIVNVSYPSNADLVLGTIFIRLPDGTQYSGYCEGSINDNANITVESQNALAPEIGIGQIIVSDLPTGFSNPPVNTTAIVLGTDGMPLSNTTVVAAEEVLSGFSGVQ